MARSTHPIHLYRRGDNYHFCCRMPKSQKPLRISLLTGDKNTAMSLAVQLSVLTKQGTITCSKELKFQRDRISHSEIDRIPAPTPDNEKPAQPLPTSTRQKPRLKTLIPLFLEEGSRLELWRGKHQKDMQNALRVFLEIVGDIRTDEFDLNQSLYYRDGLIKYPYKRHDTKRFQGKTLSQVAKMEHRTISLTTVTNHLRKLNTFSNWLVENGYLQKNPLAKVKVKKDRSDKEAVRPFTQEELSILFQSEIYTKKKYYRAYHYWLPLLGYYTGARIEELCQLYTDDLVLAEGHHCIRIDNTHDDQKLKTPSSRRLIPLHPHLIELGFWSFAQENKLIHGQERLFPDLNKIGGEDGQYSHAVSKWFGRHRRRLGITDNKTVFHSFRHGFIDQLRMLEVDTYLIKVLVGHAGKGTTETIYGNQSPVALTAKSIFDINRLALK